MKIQNPIPARRDKIQNRPAFTLVEMLVALAVMVVAMAVVTTVFSVSTRTAATSAAIAEVQSSLRSLVEQIEDDLRGCDPAKSVLVIVGRTQAAALTPDTLAARQRYRVLVGDSEIVRTQPNPAYDPRFDTNAQSTTWTPVPRDQYSDPRADILMFFTQRACVSKCPPTDSPVNFPNDPRNSFLGAIARGAKIAPAQIVYGHAAIGAATRQPNGAWTFNATGNTVNHIESGNPLLTLSAIPANQWILARKQVLIDDNSDVKPSPKFDNVPTPIDHLFFGGDGSQAPGAGPNGEFGEFTRLLRCYGGDGTGANGSSHYAGDAAAFPLTNYLRWLSPAGYRQRLLQNAATADALQSEGSRQVLAYPYPVTGIAPPIPAWKVQDYQNYINGVLYPGGNPAKHHVATVLRDAPPELQSNAALQAQRGCAWFQVEFLLPEDPRNAVDSPVATQRNDMPRWVEVPPGETFCFVPDTDENRALIRQQVNGIQNGPSDSVSAAFPFDRPDQSPPQAYTSRLKTFRPVIPDVAPYGGQDSATNRRVRLWPYAIRITIRAYDEKSKLSDPLVRTIVHRFD